MAKRPTEMWAFWANAFGPSFRNPVKVKRDGDSAYWWHKDGDHEARKVGLDVHGWVCFAHPDKQRVQDFADGFNQARRIMREFCGDD